MRFSPRLSAALLIAFTLLRVASTFRTFSATTDAAWHVGSGLEVIQYHRYRLQKANPPLPQVVSAIAPYLGGMRARGAGNIYEQIYPVSYNEHKFLHRRNDCRSRRARRPRNHWGQDVLRLRSEVSRLGVDHLTVVASDWSTTGS